jgi:phage terminase large subunit GpA-like protein
MERQGGVMCKENRECFIFLLAAVLLCSAWGALHGQEVPQPGQTHLSSRSSERSSSSSAGHFQTWETLSVQFETALNQHEATLNEALGKLKTSEANRQKLSVLLTLSLKQNEDLRNFNSQIGERMQERDEDLSGAYDDIDRLMRQRNTLLAIAITAGVIILALVVFMALRLLRVIP